MNLITVGSKVKLKDAYTWLAEKYNLTLGKEYEVIKTNKFWCSATIVNDIGKNTTFDVSRFDLVPEKLDFDNLVIGGTFSGKTQIPFILKLKENNKQFETQLIRYCPDCQRLEHELQATFCSFCGTALKTSALLEFYLSLKIPFEKIQIEKQNIEKYTCSAFPFFLYKHDRINQTIEVVTFNEYPKGVQLYVKLPALSPQADSAATILLDEGTLDKLLKEDFEWFHQTEKETLW